MQAGGRKSEREARRARKVEPAEDRGTQEIPWILPLAGRFSQTERSAEGSYVVSPHGAERDCLAHRISLDPPCGTTPAAESRPDIGPNTVRHLLLHDDGDVHSP